jgi:hypothetical protein
MGRDGGGGCVSYGAALGERGVERLWTSSLELTGILYLATRFIHCIHSSY